MSRPALLFFSAEDIRRALPMAEAVEAMKEAFARLSSGEAVQPPRTRIEVSAGKGDALFMPSYIPSEGRLAVKVVTVCGENAARGLPRIQALVLLFDAATGCPLAVLEGTALTALRTGAASGAATDLLARRDSRAAAIFGAGAQGRTQLEGVLAVRDIRKVRIFDPSRDLARAFAQEARDAFDLDIEAAGSPSEALREADIVCTATTSPAPVFTDGDLRPGTHVNAVGSYRPWIQEIPAETVLRARVVVDHFESALAEAGELIVPLKDGLFGKDHISAELGEIASGRKPGRTSASEITLFKSVGVAVQDLAAAARVLERGRRLGLGTEISL